LAWGELRIVFDLRRKIFFLASGAGKLLDFFVTTVRRSLADDSVGGVHQPSKSLAQQSMPPGVGAMKKIYVGNLSYEATEDELRDLFAAHGTVESVAIVTDRMTGRPRGFGFVEMADDAEARAAIDALNGTDLGGRTLTVNEARPRAEGGGRRGGGGGGGRRGGGGGGGGGGRRPRW